MPPPTFPSPTSPPPPPPPLPALVLLLNHCCSRRGYFSSPPSTTTSWRCCYWTDVPRCIVVPRLHVLLPLLLLFLSGGTFSSPFMFGNAQLAIIAPPTLKEKLCPPSSPLLPGATSTFGSPSYGEVILGRMYYIESPSKLCSRDVTMDDIYGSDPHRRRLGDDTAAATTTTLTTTLTTTKSTTTTSTTTPILTTTTSSHGSSSSAGPASPPPSPPPPPPPPPHNPAPSSSLIPPFHARSTTLRNIFVIRRGDCTFVEKARNAQHLKADAVVVVDSPDSSWNRDDIRHVIMADNGKGYDIEIPSLLITNADGETIIVAIKNKPKDGDVYAELEWSVPRRGVVDVDFWTDNTREDEGRRFLKEFAHSAKVLGPHLHFAIHFFLFQMPPKIAGELCLSDEGTFCAEAPAATTLSSSGKGLITGRDVVEEDMRQLCLFDSTERKVSKLPGSEWSPVFWDYLAKWDDMCQINGTTAESRYGKVCAERVLNLIDTHAFTKVKECMEGTRGKKLLQREKDNKNWSVLTLRVNDIRFSGRLEASSVTKAVCAGFQTPPDGCKSLLSDIENKKVQALTEEIVHSHAFALASSSAAAVSTSTIWLVVFFVLVIIGLALYIYQKLLKDSVRETLRHEVILEVRTQMQEYQQMPDDTQPSEAYRQSRPLLY
eukprot:GHVS01050812.1.p1 GENE.GHVS01050812.1~~GHVS01050812.1.p1  ORF type:complete len:659 (+),score=163.48 GHVS01050812.1:262-2238(+)